MKSRWISGILLIVTVMQLIYTDASVVYADNGSMVLNALSACLIDADNGRVLFEKNGYEKRAMASTTKIMTLLVTLENANMDDIVTISSNAARQPDVQLNVNTGEQYVLGDLVYSLMLESHNDVAVAIAEHVGGSVEGFAKMMNTRARELGCEDTYFITPNGLDASDENGAHSTTAVDMARIAAYALKNETFCEIIKTRSHTFSEVNGKRSFTVNNKDAFLDMMEGACGIKTGFTGNAGYCFVGAVKQSGRTFISVVFASGWPPNKTYKWKDTRKLMQYGIDNFFPECVYEGKTGLDEIAVSNGIEDSVRIECTGELTLLLAEGEKVSVYYDYPDIIEAPVNTGERIGSVYVYVGDEQMGVFPVVTETSASRINYKYCFFKVLHNYLFTSE